MTKPKFYIFKTEAGEILIRSRRSKREVKRRYGLIEVKKTKVAFYSDLCYL